ncbi:FadR/GntR family transcriptional regulator [Allorhizobium sp. NPDC080224]|uniref:FadR/GntR family transcriptional regulator n=1 Tax=Allorhizobium sp. NPDC080224 TaxID=3390547 RepID=UPI003D0154E9
MAARAAKRNGGDVASESAVAATVKALVAMIGEGRWPRGTVLPPQRELAKLLDISRATLREAISVLLTTGEIRARDNGRGFTIADAADRAEGAVWPHAARYSLREVYQLRHVVESYAAQLAGMSRTDADLANLRQALEAFRSAARSADLTAYAEADFEFHRSILAISGNRLLIDMHHTFAGVMLESQRMPALRPGDLWPAVKEHELILEAIERGDPDGANYYMRRHISMGGSRSGLAPAELP